jgi:Protein of unknown function (DUF3800)
VYLDEAGISHRETALCVAGVLVHGDFESGAVEEQFDILVERYIPETDRLGFVFHAKDIFHGSGYFDRDHWPKETRFQILSDLAGIIDTLKLPVVAGLYRKDGFGAGTLSAEDSEDRKRVIMQTVSVFDCLIWTDRWLEKFSPSENAVVIAEDTDRVKPLIKFSVRMLRSPIVLKEAGLEQAAATFGMPLKRIIDTVHFAAKSDARALQLADLCAFTLGRGMKGKDVPLTVFQIIWDHLKWVLPIARAKGVSLPTEPTDFSLGQLS